MSIQSFLFLFLFSFAFCSQGHSQAVITSATSGFWDEPATWSGGVVPGHNQAVGVASGHAVVVRNICQVQDMTLSGTLVVSKDGVLKVTSGAGLSVEGVLDIFGVVEGGDGSLIRVAGGGMIFRNGATYRHLYTTQEGVIPQASWEPQSTLEIAGYTTVRQATLQGGWNQRFGHVVWNTLRQSVVFDLKGMLGSLQGNLHIISTGAANLLLWSQNSAGELSVAGDVTLSGSSSLELTNAQTGKFTLTCGGDLSVNTSGYLSMATDGEGTMIVTHDLTVSQGAVRETGTASGTFMFSGSRRHVFRRGPGGEQGTFQGRINYTVPAPDTLDLGNAVLANGSGNSNANALTLEGTLMLGSVDELGAIQHNTTGGNVRTALTRRTFVAGSRIVYSGQAPQFMGNAGPAGAIATNIDNPSGVTAVANTSVAGKLTLQRGALYIGTGRTLTLSGGIALTGGFLDGTAASTLVIDGATPGIVELAFHPSGRTILGSLTVDLAAPSVTMKLRSPLRIAGQVNLMSGRLVHDGLLCLDHDATLVRWPEGQLEGQGPKTVTGAQYNLVYKSASVSGGPLARVTTGLELPADQGSLKSLTIQTAQRSDSILLTHDITIQHALNMDRGVLYAGSHHVTFRGALWKDDTGNFGQGTGVVIFSDSTWIGGTTNATFKAIRVLPGAYLGFTRNATITGDIDFQPGSKISARTIVFTLDGAVTQRVSASSAMVGGLIIAKTNAQVQLLSPLRLAGILRFNAPSKNITFRSDGFLTLCSETDTVDAAAANGMIYRLQDGNTVSGAVTVERFMRGEGRIYRYLSSPVNHATIASWKDDFAITGNFKDPTSGGTLCGHKIVAREPSLFYFDEHAAAYVNYPPAGRAARESEIETGRGYTAFIRQCNSPTIIDVTGEIHQQQISLPVTYTANGASSQNGWNLVGNPYPCTIDWDNTAQGWLKRNISPTIAIPDNGGGGFFRYWDGDGEPSTIPEGRIAVGQAFWVRATAPDPSLVIREGVKVTQQSEFFRRKSSKGVLALHLKHQSYVDHAYIKIRAGGLAGIDSFDAPKLDNALYDLAIQSADSVMMAINVLGAITCHQAVGLDIKDHQPGIYTLQADATGVFEGYTIMLRDKFTGENIAMGQGMSYTFSVTQEVGSVRHDRFELSWNKPQAPGRLVQETYTLCDRQAADIRIADADPVITYELWREGVFFSPSLTVSADSLPAGESAFRVKWNGKCDAGFLDGMVHVVHQRPDSVHLTVHEGNWLCADGAGPGEWTWGGAVVASGESCIRAFKPGRYTYRTVSADVCTATGTIDYLPVYPALLFPNPVSQGYLTVLTDFPDVQSMTLVDASGIATFIFDPAFCEREKMGIFEVSKLKPGIYFLRIAHRNGDVNVWPVIKE